MADIKRMRQVRQNNLASYHEQLHAVIAATIGRTVNSPTFPRTRVAPANKEVVDLQRVKDPIAREFRDEEVLGITMQGFTDICRDLKINAHNLLGELERHGLLKDPFWLGLDKRGRVSLFRGTSLPSANTQTRAIAIDLKASREQEHLAESDDAPPVVAINETRATVH
jgi:hypothetical protein